MAFRQHTLLPLDGCLYALQETIPHLSRSALHRCFQHHGVSRLPLSEDGESAPKKKLKDYPIGYLHVDYAEVHTAAGRQYLFVTIDRTSKVAFAELHPQAKGLVAADFLRRVLVRQSLLHSVMRTCFQMRTSQLLIDRLTGAYSKADSSQSLIPPSGTNG